MLKKFKYLLFTLCFIPYRFPLLALANMKAKPDNTEVSNGFAIFVKEYNVIIGGVVAVGVLTGLLAFIYLLTKLAAVGDNPKERSDILKELFFVGINTSLLGAFYFIVSIYYSIMIG